jgi:hypothetical protein
MMRKSAPPAKLFQPLPGNWQEILAARRVCFIHKNDKLEQENGCNQTDMLYCLETGPWQFPFGKFDQ